MKRLRYVYFLFRHYVTANTRHGTHSPFVYRLLDEVVYRYDEPSERGIEQVWKESGWRPRRTDKLIARLARYQKTFAMVQLAEPHTGRDTYWQAVLPDVRLLTAADDLATIRHIGFLYIERAAKTGVIGYPDFSDLLRCMEHSSVILYREPYLDADSNDRWNRIKQLPEVTVTIDLFHLGLAFMKKDQRPQHFSIRF